MKTIIQQIKENLKNNTLVENYNSLKIAVYSKCKSSYPLNIVIDILHKQNKSQKKQVRYNSFVQLNKENNLIAKISQLENELQQEKNKQAVLNIEESKKIIELNSVIHHLTEQGEILERKTTKLNRKLTINTNWKRAWAVVSLIAGVVIIIIVGVNLSKNNEMTQDIRNKESRISSLEENVRNKDDSIRSLEIYSKNKVAEFKKMQSENNSLKSEITNREKIIENYTYIVNVDKAYFYGQSSYLTRNQIVYRTVESNIDGWAWIFYQDSQGNLSYGWLKMSNLKKN